MTEVRPYHNRFLYDRDLLHERVIKYARIRFSLLHDLKNVGLAQLRITCSKSTRETLENGNKYVQS